MTNAIVVVFLLVASSIEAAENVRVPVIVSQESECYEFIGRDQEQPPYSISSLCIVGSSAWYRKVFFNDEYLDAVCYQSGVVLQKKGENFEIEFDEGSCDNGRSFHAGKEHCHSNSDRSLSCFVDDEELIYTAIKHIK